MRGLSKFSFGATVVVLLLWVKRRRAHSRQSARIDTLPTRRQPTRTGPPQRTRAATECRSLKNAANSGRLVTTST
jgi:hypothetical protein